MIEAEWAAIVWELRIVRRDGRPVADPRARINAIVRVAIRGLPWRLVPDACGKPGTISRHVRRRAGRGLWMRLLGRCQAQKSPPALKRANYWIFRAERRAMRVPGELTAIAAEQLGAITTLPVLQVSMRRESNLEYVRIGMRGMIAAAMGQPLTALIGLLKQLLSFEKRHQGRPWHRKFAPP